MNTNSLSWIFSIPFWLLVGTGTLTVFGCEATGDSRTVVPELQILDENNSVYIAHPELVGPEEEITSDTSLSQQQTSSLSLYVNRVTNLQEELQFHLRTILRGQPPEEGTFSKTAINNVYVPFSHLEDFTNYPETVHVGERIFSFDASVTEIQEHFPESKFDLVILGSVQKTEMATGTRAEEEMGRILPSNTGLIHLQTRWRIVSLEKGKDVLRVPVSDYAQVRLFSDTGDREKVQMLRQSLSRLAYRSAWDVVSNFLPHRRRTIPPAHRPVEEEDFFEEEYDEE